MSYVHTVPAAPLVLVPVDCTPSSIALKRQCWLPSLYHPPAVREGGPQATQSWPRPFSPAAASIWSFPPRTLHAISGSGRGQTPAPTQFEARSVCPRRRRRRSTVAADSLSSARSATTRYAPQPPAGPAVQCPAAQRAAPLPPPSSRHGGNNRHPLVSLPRHTHVELTVGGGPRGWGWGGSLNLMAGGPAGQPPAAL